MRSSRLRRVLLAVTGLVFAGIAVGSLVAPHKMADGLGYSLDLEAIGGVALLIVRPSGPGSST